MIGQLGYWAGVLLAAVWIMAAISMMVIYMALCVRVSRSAAKARRLRDSLRW